MAGGPHTQLANLRNAQYFYDWGFLDRGSFYNITIPQSDIYGGDRHKLRSATDPNYSDGQVWEAYRKNWVWESGISATTEQPIQISGVFVDDVFYATGNTTKPFYIDYTDGKIIFDSAQSTTSDVELEYSHKWVEVIPAEGVPFFREIQQGSLRSEENFQVSNSGGWAQLGQSRVQMPAIAIEVVPARSLEPYQLGGGQWVNNDIIFYVISENHWECANLVDSILYQNDRTIHLFDPTAVAISGVFPFNYRGELNENAIPSGLYPNMIDEFFYRRCHIYDSRGDDINQISPDLYIGTARCSTQVKAI
jgi:hypothetical protein